MLSTIRAVIKEGRIELLEPVYIPDGTELLVTVMSEAEDFWSRASELSLATVWDNKEDDVYEYLLQG